MKRHPLHKRVLDSYQQILNINKLMELKNKALKEKKQDIAKILIASEFKEDIEQVAFEAFTESSLYLSDKTVEAFRLCTLVESYMELEGVEELPNEVLELSKELYLTIPKTNFVFSDSGEAQEKEKGFVDKVKAIQAKSGEIQAYVDQLKNMLDV